MPRWVLMIHPEKYEVKAAPQDRVRAIISAVTAARKALETNHHRPRYAEGVNKPQPRAFSPKDASRLGVSTRPKDGRSSAVVSHIWRKVRAQTRISNARRHPWPRVRLSLRKAACSSAIPPRPIGNPGGMGHPWSLGTEEFQGRLLHTSPALRLGVDFSRKEGSAGATS